jgi:serine/threonine protein kinase
MDVAGRGKDGLTVRAHSRSQQPIFEYARDRFRNEARLVSRFEHANIIRVLDFFPDYGTEYMVMEYFPGETLAEYIDRHGTIPESAAVGLMDIVLDALETVHQQRDGERSIHRDMKPSNIYLANVNASVVPKLLDFGAARNAVGERTRNLTQVLTPGYAPFEQYHTRGKQGPWTDVYGSAATLYHMLAGQRPVAAPDRLEGERLSTPREVMPDVSEPVSTAVMSGLELDGAKRPQTAAAFRQMLDQAVSAGPVGPPSTTVAPDVSLWNRLSGIWRGRATHTRLFGE